LKAPVKNLAFLSGELRWVSYLWVFLFSTRSKSLYRPDCYRVTTDLRHHLFAGAWVLTPLVMRIYPIYRARTGVITFAVHAFVLIHARQVVFKICCKMRLGRNYISSNILKPLGRPRSRSEDNIKMHLTGIGWDWVLVAQDRDIRRSLVNTVMNLQIPHYSGNFFIGWGCVSLPRWTLPCRGIIYVHIFREDVLEYSTVIVTVMKQYYIWN
jgi:hypothetical protein